LNWTLKSSKNTTEDANHSHHHPGSTLTGPSSTHLAGPTMKALMAQFSESSMPAPMQLKLGMPKHNDYSWTASFSEAIGLQHPLPTSKLL